MKLELVDREPVTVAYFRHLGAYGEPVARFWQDVYVPWAIKSKLGRDHVRYGISHDNPAITVPAQCRYDACAEVPPNFIPSGGASKSTIAGGRYAVLEFKGSTSEIGETWVRLHQDWLPSSGMKLDGRPCFEAYRCKRERRDDRPDIIECQLFMPVIAVRQGRCDG